LAETLIFDLISIVCLIAALLLFLTLTARYMEQRRGVAGSLRFQMSLVVGVWLLSELPKVVSSAYLPSGDYSGETSELIYETVHFASMMMFAVFMTWRALRFIR